MNFGLWTLFKIRLPLENKSMPHILSILTILACRRDVVIDCRLHNCQTNKCGGVQTTIFIPRSTSCGFCCKVCWHGKGLATRFGQDPAL